MKKKLLIVFSIATLIVFGLLINNRNTSINGKDKLREQHATFLNDSPFKETLKLSKAERKAKGIPPNKYNEQMFELTMDLSTGRPHPERLFELQESLASTQNRVPGETTTPWTERGPDNVGGRTRAIMFDPNDATNNRVFAGGVSGGLWVNEDITDANSAWSEVGIPQNLAISCITYDPNDLNTFYVGTGESYVGGDVNGNGVWRSTDAGITWSHFFGGITGETTFEANANLQVNSPASISGDYISILSTNFGGDLSTPITGNLVLANDGTNVTDDGCETLTNGGTINGNIAVIRRGDCPFVTKVLNAQNAGAVAVIMVNNVSGPPISMGGANGSITIPAIMVSRDDGNAIIAELGNTVNATMELSGSTFIGNFVTPGVQHINDIVVRDAGSGVSEVYVAAGESFYGDSSPSSLLGVVDFGLYKTDDDGVTWDKLTLNTGQGGLFCPNDLEIGADNKIWVSTTNNVLSGTGGGRVLSSSDGVNFTIRRAIANGDRTQIAVSKLNPGTVYVLAERSSGAALEFIKTIDEFATTVTIQQPQDVDTAPRLVDDFTGGQAFYDLMLAVDPTDDDNLYVGGIDLFKSTNAGTSWFQISKWSNNNNLAALNVSLVHADQHTVVFGNNDPSKLLFSNDGGVYYSSNSGVTISARNLNYNTLQFYKGAIGSDSNNEKFLAGAQDNGSQLINNASAGINSSNEIAGGDGAYVFIDKDNGYMISSYVFNVYRYHNYTSGNQVYTISGNQSDGSFINPAALDSDNNILYANGSINGGANQIYRYALGSSSASRTTLSDATLLTGIPTAFKTSTFTTSTLFVGTRDGKLLKITNANTSPTWSDITGVDFFGSISCIELGATENDIYVTFYNYGVENIFYSDDGGTSWQNKEGNFPDIPVRAIMTNPLNENEVIIGTDLGVWATPDFSVASPNWYQSQNGMKDVPITSFDLRTADNVVLASTYGRGMFTGQFTADASQLGLSVDEFSKNDLIKIYPTVSDGNVTISRNSDVREGSISVFDLNGRNVHSAKVNFDNVQEQPLSLNLSSGTYIVRFASEGLKSSQKIIIE